MTPRSTGIFRGFGFVLSVLLAGCQALPQLGLTPLGGPTNLEAAPPRVNSTIPVGGNRTAAFEDRRSPTMPVVAASSPVNPAGQAAGDVTLNFVDTDIREIVRVILGTTLKLNYTIDPTVHGTATLDTGKPLAPAALLPALEAVLNQNGATLVQRGGLYAVVPIGNATATNAVSDADVAGSGAQVVPLQYASARDLAKLLQPYVGEGSKLTADPGRNALIIGGDTAARQAMIGLIHAFDVDVLAGQSLAIFPVEGNAATLAAGLEKALQAEHEGPLGGLVRVVPLPRVNAVLVASAQPSYLDAARRFFRLTHRVESETARTWHIYYVQNGQSSDLALLLQRAFTPDHVTVTEPGSVAPGAQPVTMGAGQGFEAGALGGPASGGALGSSGIATNPAPATASGPATAASTLGNAAAKPATPPTTEPLSTESGTTEDQLNRIRIIANSHNNALLIYATPSEYTVIDGMLRKIDITPLQVLIDATIAEVTLNDQLAYGTQFFIGGKVSGILTTGSPVAPTSVVPGAVAGPSPTVVTVGGIPATLGSNFPGFVLANGAREVLNALSAVTTVKILSSPQVMVLDNEPAHLQVGQQVPILTGTATSTLTTGAPIVNSIDYHSTGVIMQVTPHINTGGLVTLDVAQEVSDVATPAANTATGSPTFDDRIVRTSVAVQDGQTVALAGLIRDNSQEGNSGLPFLKDVPVVGTLFSSQNNTRARTELIVLITPRVVQNQENARALTEDLRKQLINAALIPQELSHQPIRGRANPNGL